MLYILDTASLEDIKKGFEYLPVVGVTTNPTIISKDKVDFFAHFKKIRECIGEDAMLHIQVTSDCAEDMVMEAKKLEEVLGGNLYVKVPVSLEGLKAIKLITALDIKVTATAVITVNQALMAAAAGASFVAPYVNRIDNLGASGVDVVSKIVDAIDLYGYDCMVLAASFKNTQQLQDCIDVGCHSATAPLDILLQAISHPLTDWSLEQFKKDWKTSYGDKKITEL